MSMQVSIIELKNIGGIVMAKSTEDKAERILSIYSRLKQGKVINRAEESTVYGVAERTVQRDIESIKCFLQNQNTDVGEIQDVVFDKQAGGYILQTKQNNHLRGKEILTVGKVLLESRALMKNELFPIIHKLTELCSSEAEKRMVKDLLNNEKFHYTELQHGKNLLDIVWDLEYAVKKQQYVEIEYRKQTGETVLRKVKPVGIMFSEFYFYLTAFMEEEEKKNFKNPEDTFPTIYRIDRIESFKVLDEHFRVPYAERFEEGEFRKRVQFMYGGRLKKVRFKYKGNSIEAVLDRLPTAQILKKGEDGILVQAEVFGDGIEMWFRSQGEQIKEINFV